MPSPKSPPTLAGLRKELQKGNDPARAAFLKRFFKCGPGEYGEGDAFRGGFTVPQVRALARAYRHLSVEDAAALLDSEWHEDRQLALFHLVHLFERGAPPQRARIHKLYLRQVGKGVNNWDLVDGSAPQIVGGYFAPSRAGEAGGDGGLLDRWARDKNLWRRRVAMLATFHGIKRGRFGDALRIAETLLEDREDLIHKAAGWMLREVGKRDLAPLDAFLEKHAARMPRTMLRYAIEKYPEAARRKWMAMKAPAPRAEPAPRASKVSPPTAPRRSRRAPSPP
jgi:3-methyladenine DNA glycosylase AlkD